MAVMSNDLRGQSWAFSMFSSVWSLVCRSTPYDRFVYTLGRGPRQQLMIPVGSGFNDFSYQVHKL